MEIDWIHEESICKEGGKYYSHNANWVDAEVKYVQSAPHDSLWDIVIDIAGRDAKPISMLDGILNRAATAQSLRIKISI